VVSTSLSESLSVRDTAARHRTAAVLALSSRAVLAGWASRMGRFYAWATALGHALVAGYLSLHGDAAGVLAIVVRGLAWVSWAAGAVAWSAARDVDEEERKSGVQGLEAARGIGPRARRVASSLATIAVVARTVAFPGLAMAVVTLAFLHSVRLALAFVPVAFGIALYALVFGAVFGGLARLSARLSPRQGRAVFAALVFFPYAMSEVFPGAPNVISAFSWLIERVADLGNLVG
jgi:hypothetical protein